MPQSSGVSSSGYTGELSNMTFGYQDGPPNYSSSIPDSHSPYQQSFQYGSAYGMSSEMRSGPGIHQFDSIQPLDQNYSVISPGQIQGKHSQFKGQTSRSKFHDEDIVMDDGELPGGDDSFGTHSYLLTYIIVSDTEDESDDDEEDKALDGYSILSFILYIVRKLGNKRSP
jgi:hypothetical protein